MYERDSALFSTADYIVDAGCITSPNMHAQDQSRAAGTAFAISYHSDLKDVTPENLVVFSVRYNTPWKRVIYYDVPASLPACPPEDAHAPGAGSPTAVGSPTCTTKPSNAASREVRVVFR
ncbi:hypothetical protein DFP72DRAFT_1105352 [Ephemerocybe angulata]|uniref:Uncharacterized protein n=1 Tax=Ephemerocybe angulata TaxID=980116 RepID=A0A8H6MA68_9AGAR|nr:hypothetical protein DFP72DRAFT_1105352 [Tulosesus angulatus]